MKCLSFHLQIVPNSLLPSHYIFTILSIKLRFIAQEYKRAIMNLQVQNDKFVSIEHSQYHTLYHGYSVHTTLIINYSEADKVSKNMCREEV